MGLPWKHVLVPPESNQLTMSRQWRGHRRGLGEDQAPVALPLHAVKASLGCRILGRRLTVTVKTSEK